ncbi:cytochrome c oxidase assembly protein [Actinophytocola algeriensis]|uniref:Putative copper resistance protein D n=1 Tax=Actinophytocola algeriensis TaxID=1768010 RepID=A0A7W7VC20_9PSEU|nr:cytochrome c oxidase assembly protein [Actinophytocola algeriensis]MBB4904575.1 putative copper resistance protein D [Actinophytocola algeriensis]MBE1476566.1 putative copper resistance protein D [Actinophytocola algeriensis]
MSVDSTAKTAHSRIPSVVPLIFVSAPFAALVAVVLLSYTAPDATLDVQFGAAVRVAAEAGAVLTVGCLLFAAFLVAPQKSGLIGAGGYAALRTAAWSALVWFAGAVASVPFLVADAIGRPVSTVLRDPALMFELVGVLEQAKAWLITAGIALFIAFAAFVMLSWGWITVLFGLSVFGVLPVPMTGHSSSGGNHDLASNSLVFHLVAASLWVGGLVALMMYARRFERGPAMTVAATRFSSVALVCWIAMAVSGVINAWVRVPVSTVFDSSYGWLVIAKIVALGLLGAFGYFHRQYSVRAIQEGGTSRLLVRLAAVEVLVMFLTIGIAVALARTPPPPLEYLPGQVELELGYPIDAPPTLLNLLTAWRFDLIFGTLAIAMAVLYLMGVRKLLARGDKWPMGRVVAWLAGCATILFATSSGIGRYSAAMFSVHMEVHMMLSMLAPVLLVLGGPVTLALRSLPVAGKDGVPGPREWLLALVRSPLSRFLTNPIVALVLFVGSFYVLYFSGLFDWALDKHWAHLLMNAHFLLVGYVFYWPVIGIDPSPRRLPHVARLGMVFASLPFHAFFGVILMGMNTVIGQEFYQRLALRWNSDLLSDQRLGGGIAWAAGELPLLIVLVALLVQWARADDREARRQDRRADMEGDDSDHAAYNAMLKKLN